VIIALAVAVLVAVALAVLRTRLVRVTVHGDSMAPALRSGERVLVRRARAATLRRGDLVVFRAPRDPARAWMIKRVLAAPGDPVPRADVPNLWRYSDAVVPADRLVVLGDNPSVSYDSRQFGYVDAGTVLGRVVAGRATALRPQPPAGRVGSGSPGSPA
jgi:signal peptidase I